MNSVPPPIPREAPKKAGMPTWALVLIIVGGVGLVMVAVIGLLAAIAIPNFVRARENAQRAICLNHLSMIDGAKQSWAVQNQKTNTDVPSQTDLVLYLKDERFPVCPKGGVYTIGAVDTDPTCSIPGHQLTSP